MNNVKIFEGIAAKSSGKGNITYALILDERGVLYITFQKNDINSKSPGTFSRLGFSVRTYVDNPPKPSSDIEGINLDTGERQTTNDNNVSAFLRAVLDDIFLTKEV